MAGQWVLVPSMGVRLLPREQRVADPVSPALRWGDGRRCRALWMTSSEPTCTSILCGDAQVGRRRNGVGWNAGLAVDSVGRGHPRRRSHLSTVLAEDGQRSSDL